MNDENSNKSCQNFITRNFSYNRKLPIVFKQTSKKIYSTKLFSLKHSTYISSDKFKQIRNKSSIIENALSVLNKFKLKKGNLDIMQKIRMQISTILDLESKRNKQAKELHFKSINRKIPKYKNFFKSQKEKINNKIETMNHCDLKETNYSKTKIHPKMNNNKNLFSHNQSIDKKKHTVLRILKNRNFILCKEYLLNDD